MVLDNFIVLEGIDGAGTTTQLHLLQQSAPTGTLLVTAEPTQCETGVFLRRMLGGHVALTPQTAAHLFAADRAEHVWGALEVAGGALTRGIEQATRQGYAVASDRYLFSSLAYQGAGCGMELPRRLNQGFPLPELLFFLQIEPEAALHRISSRGGEHEIYERLDVLQQTAAAYDRVIASYEAQSAQSALNSAEPVAPASLNPGEQGPHSAESVAAPTLNSAGHGSAEKRMRIFRIDATQSPQEIARFIWQHAQNLPIFRG